MGGRKMTGDALAKFKIDFHHLTGNSPFPWQESLFARFVDEAAGGIPASCNIPTGLGKTAVIAVWLALMRRPDRIPRRLVYVVNRRTVVTKLPMRWKSLRENLPWLIRRRPSTRNLAITTHSR